MTTLLADHRPEALSTDSPRVTVNLERCAGCQECVVRCPVEALSMDVETWKAVADDALCIGCRQCVRTCPFSAIEVEGPALVTERWHRDPVLPASLLGNTAEVHPGFASFDEALAEAERCLACPDPTCVRGCPAHNDIPGFIAAIRDGNLEAAHQILGRTTVLPDICSRVCDWAKQCEGACSWTLAGAQPVAIGSLERFVTDNHEVPGVERKSDVGAGVSVAIVGSGPAGVGAAWELLSHGARVTMFEKEREPLGVLRWGIPSFSLPDSLLERPIAALQQAGLELVTESEITPDGIDALLQSHDAVVLANGAPIPLPLRFPGADLAGVEDATRFLARAKIALSQGQRLPEAGAGRSVLVIGAGNTAMDVARSVRRFGGNVVAVDWMDRRFARVRPDELLEAASEGVTIRFLTSVSWLEGDSEGRVVRAHLVATRQDGPGATPRILPGESGVMEVDLVVAAMGYRTDAAFGRVAPGTPWMAAHHTDGLPDRRWLASGLFSSSGKGIGETSWLREIALRRATYPFAPRLWVAGDAMIGASTVVESMAHGKRVAQAILADAARRAA
jgi:glutamate synthase (NADPH/NADH) small chain